MTTLQYTSEAVALLRQLIATPSVSRNEQQAADIMAAAMEAYGLKPQREANNLWCVCPEYNPARPTLLLNAHIDTVKPVASWTRNPFSPDIEYGADEKKQAADKQTQAADAEKKAADLNLNGTLYGLGSNDCGGGLVSLLQAYRHLITKPQSYNLVYLASAEEEVSGVNGLRRALPLLPPITVAIVGEPTGMQPAVAEKGLMVIDAVAHGKSGHAARNEGINAIYQALDDLLWLRNHRFEKVSNLLGPTLMNVTIVNAGTQHNVVPDECRFTIDIRTNEHYRNEDVFHFLQTKLKSSLTARSFHLSSSSISLHHPLVKRCLAMNKTPFGSPTLSDQALMPWPSLKLGPGQSARSLAAPEHIHISEIHNAIETYIQLLDGSEIA